MRSNLVAGIEMLALTAISSLVAASVTSRAEAACVSPTANIGSLDFQGGSFKYCDGSNWLPLGSTSFPLWGSSGTSGSPTYSFSAGTNTGMFMNGAGTLALATGGTQRLTIDGSGRVGIGTTTPGNNFQVSSTGNTYAMFDAWGSVEVILGSGSSTGNTPPRLTMAKSGGSGLPGANYTLGEIQFSAANSSWTYLHVAKVRGNLEGTPTDSSMPTYLSFLTTSSGSITPAERLRITSGGSVGIGTTNPGYTLHVVGNAGLSTGTAWTNASDIRLKDLHGDYERGLGEVLKLRPVRFSYKKGNPVGLPSTHRMTGFVAQEVQQVLPEAVSENENGFLQLNVDPIHWAVVNAVKELYRSVQDNDRDIVSLKRVNAQLEADNKALKSYLCSRDPSAPICD